MGAVSATDPEDSTITYSIEAGDSGGLFAIDSGTGTLSYQGAGEDYESGTTSHELTVRASDGGLHSDVTVAVNVTDVAEAPAFGQENYTFSLTENAGGDTIRLSLGRVSAADPEGVAVEYSLVAGNGAGLFELDAQTGDLFYVGSGEDYESGSTRFELTVRASDGNLFADATMTIDVTDVPEQEATETQQSVSEPDGQDLPEGVSTTGQVAVDGSVTGEIETRGDQDWFAVELDADTTYRIDLEGLVTVNDRFLESHLPPNVWMAFYGNPYTYGVNTYLRGVYDANGNRLADTTNDNGGYGPDSRVTFTPPADGTYYVAAGAAGNDVGAYTLSVRFADDFAATTQTTGMVAVGGSARGVIETGYDRDWFAVELDAGKTYQIDLEGSPTGDGALRDPYLFGVHDANGGLITGTRNDDGGEGRNSRVTFTAEEAATYYVAAGAWYNGEGDYTLSVEEVM